MSDDIYIRKVQTAVTNFIYYEDDYLFLHRSSDKRIDPNKLNGVGGKLEPGENYLQAAIRETEEETGYKVKEVDVQLAGVIKLEGGYEEDWIDCFFKIKVHSKEIPLGNKTKDGNLVWIHKDNVLNSDYKLVDDLLYCFDDIVKGKDTFFITAQLNSEEKIISTSISTLKKT